MNNFLGLVALSTFTTVLIVITAVLLVAVLALYIFGRKMQKKQDESQKMMDEAAQNMTLFIIDKKKMKLKESGLPKMVIDQTPKYMRRAKLPIVKVKVGPRVMTMVCDVKVFETLLPKQEVKATVSGIYITAAKRIRGPIYTAPEKKKGLKRFFSKNK